MNRFTLQRAKVLGIFDTFPHLEKKIDPAYQNYKVICGLVGVAKAFGVQLFMVFAWARWL